MRKRMKRYMSLCLTLCMLVMATPPIVLAEDGTASVATLEQAYGPEHPRPTAARKRLAQLREQEAQDAQPCMH